MTTQMNDVRDDDPSGSGATSNVMGAPAAFSQPGGITTLANAAPVISNLGDAQIDVVSVQPGARVALDIDAPVSVTDPDSPNFDRGFLRLTFSGDTDASDRVTFALGSGISVTSDDFIFVDGQQFGTFVPPFNALQNASLTIAFRPGATPASISKFLGALVFENAGSSPTPVGIRVIRVELEDPDGATATTDITLSVQTINAAPVVDLNGGAAGEDASASFSEIGGPVAIAPTAAVSQADGDSITSITVTLTNAQDGALEGLNVTSAAQNALAGVSGASDIVLQDTISITGIMATAAQVEAFLQAITYGNTSTSPNETARTVTVVLNDGTEDSVTRTSTISVDDLSDAETTGGGFDTTDGTNLTPGLTFGAGSETLTIASPLHVLGGSTAAGGAGMDQLVLSDGVDLAGLASLTGFEIVTVPFNTSVGMTAEQHNGFTAFTNTPSQTITISSGTADVTGDAFIENYVIGTSYLGDFTLGAADQNITGASGDANTILIGSLAATGTIDGGTGTDTLVMGNGGSIAAATVIGMEDLRLSSNASVTMTEAQHDAFAAGTVTASANEQITISAAIDGFSALAQIETYVLGAANTVSLGAAAGNLTQNITGSSGNDTVSFGSAAYTGTLNGGGGASDTVVLNNGADLSGATLSNFENLSLSDGATATLAAAQLGAFQGGTIAAAGAQTLNVTGDGDFTTLAGIETYIIGGDDTDTRTITLGADHAVVDADVPTDVITFNVGALTFTGLLAGRGLTDIVQLGDGADISSATLSRVENVTIDAGATVSMSEAQHDAFRTITATGTNGIVIASATDGFTTDETVESYTLGVANEVTLGTSAGHLSQDVTGSSGNDTLTLGAAAYAGALNGAGGSGDTLVLVDGSDISGATVSAFENLTIAADAAVRMSADQLAQFTGAITAPGAETMTVTGDGDFVTLANIETFDVTGDETDDARTVTIAQADVDVTATVASDAVVFDTGALTYTGTITGEGSVNDTVLIRDGGDISGATLSNIEVLWIDDDASVTVSVDQYAQIRDEAITANGAETLNIAGDGDVILSGDTVETYTFADDSTDTRTVEISAPNSASISANATTDAITFAINGGSAFTGSFTADGTTANTVQIGATGASLAGGTLSGFANLSTVGALTLTTSQANAFTGAITAAGGADTFVFASTGTLTGANLGAIETFSTVAGGAETITLSAAIADGKSLVAVEADSDAFVVTGSAGAQAVTGSSGDDTLDGGAGDDTIDGGAGSDNLIGGAGDDVFRGSAKDLDGDAISDLSADDVIVISGVILTDANVRFNASNDALEIDTDGTDFATVEVTLSLANAPGAGLVRSVSNDSLGTTTIAFGAVNAAPIADDDRFFLSGMSDGLVGNLLARNGGARDRDPNMDPIRVVNVDGSAVPQTGDTVVELSSGDIVRVSADGVFTFDPAADAGSAGREATFSYTIADSGGLSDTATVTIAITADPSDASGRTWQFGADDLQDGARISDFTPAGSIVFALPSSSIDGIQVQETATGFLIAADTDDDGRQDGSVTVEGQMGAGGFLVSSQGGGAQERVVLDFATRAPDVAEAQGLPDAAVNGVTTTAFLTGDGERRPVLSFDEGTAALNSTVGTYTVAPDGTIGEVRIIFADTNATEVGTSVTLDPLGPGHLLGMFLISDGATLAEPSAFEFVGEDETSRANALDDVAPTLLADGAPVRLDVFHAFSGLNENGDRMVWSGYDPEGGGLTLGFEDLAINVSDRDYNDVLIGIDFL